MTFAATLVGIGILGLVQRDFAPICQPVPEGFPAREVLALVCALVAAATGAGLFWRRTAALAARVLLVWLLLWMLAFRGRVIWLAPTAAVSWEGWGETAVLVAGTWTLYAVLATGWHQRRFGFAVGERGLLIARTVYGLALIAFGAAHLAYVKETASLVPAWLPAHAAWVRFTGWTYIAGGVAVVAGVCARLAATLAAVQIGLFTLLVWGPAVAAGSADASQWSEAVISWALTAGAWLVAASYRDASWLAFPGERRGSAQGSLRK
ncbi:hypothetical protein [Phenylobacterium montanum]|uniref:DoxX family protein n=1 Tax=Phenylobacterium montanum TaxID=2823693 RepID=A0A975G290_9CAUL|nr:hypothetical protein [Caulobacter sp. S6]QUD89227.1 hypothetical protein KCG34_04925 [Caulobacter sp. S6]